MTTWNYRVIKKRCSQTQEASYQIHEVYYHGDGSIDCWNHTPVEPLGVSESGLRHDIQAFLAAFRLPVLEEHFVNGKARLAEEYLPRDNEGLRADYLSKAARASGYLNQILGHHLLLKQDPELRRAYDKVDEALSELLDTAGQRPRYAEAV